MRRIVMLIAMTVAGMGLEAQDFQWGVKGGLTYNMTDLSLGDAVSTSGEVFSGDRSNNGWHLGLTARDELTDNFYVQFDALYNQTSITMDGVDENGQPVSQEFTQNAINLNLAPGVRVFKVLRAQAGLNGNLWLDNEYAETFGRFQLGYQLGVGLDFGPLTFDIGYNTSFKDHDGEWNGIPLSTNRGELLMTVGIQF
ncbi:MAG: porin family protein [Flavobacteriia bacterium]|nr:porin family protein [Flavobacteriia bacterium]